MNETRRIRKTTRLTQGENSQIAHDAQRCGVSFSEYIREKALGNRPRGKDFSKLIHELSTIGNALNKQGGLLKHLHNKGLGYSQKTAEILSDIGKTVLVIHKTVTLIQKSVPKEESEGH